MEEGYKNDSIYKAVNKKRFEIENICISIENMEI